MLRGIIINGGPNNVVDGTPIDVRPELYEAGYPVMAAGHGAAACERSIHSWDEADSARFSVPLYLIHVRPRPTGI